MQARVIRTHWSIMRAKLDGFSPREIIVTDTKRIPSLTYILLARDHILSYNERL